MIYPRIRVAKDLLSKEGIMAISIGYNELYNLMKMCQELFNGFQVFAVTVQTSGGKPNGAFSISNEYVVFVVPVGMLPIPTEEDMKSYSSPYHGMNLATFNQNERPNQAYPIFVNGKGAIIGCGKSIQERIDDGSYSGSVGDFVYDFDEAPDGAYAIWPITAKGDQCVWRLISSRLLGDWEKGFIKVVPQKDQKGKNQFAIQYLSGGIIDKIQNGELQTYRISNDPDIPTLEVHDYKTAGSSISSVWTDSSFYTTRGSNDIRELFNGKVFSYPKPLPLVSYILKRTTSNDDTILDFFSGSATTAHATMLLNLKDEGKRKYIMVQLPEAVEIESEAYKAGYKNICEIGKERIRRAGKKIKEESPLTTQNLDTGFRVLKLDSSNMQDVYYRPEDSTEQTLFEDNIKPGRSSEDLLFQVMLECNLPLSAKIETEKIAGKEVFSVNEGYLIACFDEKVNEDVIKEVAKRKPYYFVMRDSSLATDNVADNFEQIWMAYSKDTIRRIM